jgi:hypothetical protein
MPRTGCAEPFGNKDPPESDGIVDQKLCVLGCQPLVVECLPSHFDVSAENANGAACVLSFHRLAMALDGSNAVSPEGRMPQTSLCDGSWQTVRESQR